DPGGKPFPGARLYVGYSMRQNWADRQFTPYSCPVRTSSDADGKFDLTFARSELDPRSLDDWRPAVLAVADGYGPDWVEIGASSNVPDVEIKLVEDIPLNGRILDQNHRPVAGANVFVRGVTSDSVERMTRALRGEINRWFPKRWRG